MTPISNPPSGSSIESVTKNEEGKITSIGVNGASIDTTGTPADGSVTTAKFAAANVDGAAGTPSARSLATKIEPGTKTYPPSSLAVEQIVGVRTMKPPSGSWMTTMHATAASSQQTVGNKEIMFLLPVDLAVETEFKAIGIFVQTKALGTGFVARLGYYEDDGTGAKPKGAALLDAGTTSLEAEGERNIAIEKKLAPGRYWVAFVMQASVFTTYPFITVVTPIGSGLGMKNLEANNYGSLKQTGVAGALPTIGALEVAATNPLVGLQVK